MIRLNTNMNQRLPPYRAAAPAARALLHSHVDWLDQWPWHVAFTLDFRGGVHHAAAAETARRFFHKLDCDAFGSTQVRKGRRLRRVCYRQGEAGLRNWHYHGAQALPHDPRCRFDQGVAGHAQAFGDFIMARWRSEPLAGVHGQAKPIWDQARWLGYISRDAGWDGDSLDLTTTTLPRHCV